MMANDLSDNLFLKLGLGEVFYTQRKDERICTSSIHDR